MPESKLLMDIGDRLRAQREKMGLTQKQTAALLGISETYYGEIERGNKKLTIERVLLARKHLKLDPTYLITGERNSNQLIERLLEECPKGKEDLVIQLLHYLALLYR